MTEKEILDNIGQTVFVSNVGDLAFDSEMKRLIYRKIPLTLVKMTKGKMAYLQEGKKFHSVPPRCVYK
jgi:hypothetical protein